MFNLFGAEWFEMERYLAGNLKIEHEDLKLRLLLLMRRRIVGVVAVFACPYEVAALKAFKYARAPTHANINNGVIIIMGPIHVNMQRFKPRCYGN